MNLKYGLLVRPKARPGRADDLAKLPETARELALAETGTITWYAAKSSDNTFGVFDTFAAEEGRRAHLAGEIPVAIGKSRRSYSQPNPAD